MAPTLSDGDDILVDGGDAAGRLRDGIYVLRMDDGLMVKRIARAPGPGRIAVISDNPQYRSWDDLPMAAVQLVGRVVWTGRRSEEHTSELQSLMRNSYAVFCLKKKNTKKRIKKK